MNELKKMSGSWIRAFLTAALALVAAGETDPKNIAYAGAIAVIPPILRWLNPKDESYGRSE
jgi:hypothetical protein